MSVAEREEEIGCSAPSGKKKKKGIYSLYSAVFVSTLQQSDSAIHTHIYPLFFGFPSHLGHRRAPSSLC